MTHFLLVTLAALSCLPLSGQTADDHNEGSKLVYNTSTDNYTFSWWGRSGWTYFLQTSTDLFGWTYVPTIIESGNDAVLSYGFSYSLPNFGDAVFLRLNMTDKAGAAGTSGDADGDRISNQDEFNQGTDPMSIASNDGDTIPDDWEIFYGLDTTTGVDSSSSDGDSDTLSDYQEFYAGTNPNTTDTLLVDSTNQAQIQTWKQYR